MYNEKGKNTREQINKENEKHTIEYGEMKNGIEWNDDMIKEGEDIWAEVLSDKSLQDVTAPPEMRENIFEAIREKEAAKESDSNANDQTTELSDEQKELIYLRKAYKRSRRVKKYLILVAAMVMVLAFGITSTGAGEKIFNEMIRLIGEREQNHVDSDDIVPITTITEEEAYQQIEDKYGFLPVRMLYYPEGIEFQEVINTNEIQGINMIYGKDEKMYIRYLIRPNYRDGSWGQDVEDELLQEYEVEISNTMLEVRQYLVEKSMVRWSVCFEYKDVSYFIMIQELEQEEVEKVIENLYFY